MTTAPGVLRRLGGRVGTWFLAVNLVVLLVPVAGIEFARIYERQLLSSLERDMRNQSALVRASLETRLAHRLVDGVGDPRAHLGEELRRAARSTRTRIRVLDETGALAADSHAEGPPEGIEPLPPEVLPDPRRGSREVSARAPITWPDVPDRPEVREALAGRLGTATRIRDRAPEVLLFLAEPVTQGGRVRGAVYVTRSTQPVLLELYRIRSALVDVLAVAVLVSGAITLALGFTISRPLSRLVEAARRVARGELSVPIPDVGRGEIRELGAAFAAMKDRLLARLRFSSDFAADVAHELKSPLTSIRGAAELLAEGAFDDEAARARFLDNILLDVARLDALVSRLLLLGRIEASELPMQPVDVSAVARAVADRAGGARVRVLCEGEPVEVFARAADVSTALTNLVDNAVRHAPDGSEVRVVVERLGPSGARLTVHDAGSGISPANLPRIFDRFFTTEAERGGTGLGLAIVRSVAEAHGGRVACASAPGEGTTFTLTLRDPAGGERLAGREGRAS